MDKAEKVFEKIAVSPRLIGKALGNRVGDIKFKKMQLPVYRGDKVEQANKVEELSKLINRTKRQAENVKRSKPEVFLDDIANLNLRHVDFM